jgi:hypothetical protein
VAKNREGMEGEPKKDRESSVEKTPEREYQKCWEEDGRG